MAEATRTTPAKCARKKIAQVLLNEYALSTLQLQRETLRQGISLSVAEQRRILKIAEALATEI